MAEEKKKFSEGWERLSSNTRRNIVLGSIGIFLFGVLFIFVSGDSKASRRPVKEDIAREIFTSTNNKELGLQGMSVSVKRVEAENEKLKKQLEVLQKEIEKAKRNSSPQENINMDQIRAQAAKEALEVIESRYGSVLKQKPAPTPPVQQVQKPVQPMDGFDPSAPSASENPYGITPKEVDWAASAETSTQTDPSKPGQSPAKTKTAKMRVITSENAQKEENEEAKKKERDDSIFIPAGSIFSGTLITGMDAPTNESARRSPFPALLRIKKDAILPNRYRADVKECFMISSGYGDLSSERAYLRAETISCIRNDGGVIEAPIDMYAVGEDGKAGIRGILVSKQGALLARSLLAGAMDSFARIFTTSPVPTLSTSVSDKTPFQNVLSKDAVQAAGVQGFGSAMERLANYFMDMAENIFPVIEVAAGRQVDFVMTKGTSLKLR